MSCSQRWSDGSLVMEPWNVKHDHFVVTNFHSPTLPTVLRAVRAWPEASARVRVAKPYPYYFCRTSKCRAAKFRRDDLHRMFYEVLRAFPEYRDHAAVL